MEEQHNILYCKYEVINMKTESETKHNNMNVFYYDHPAQIVLIHDAKIWFEFVYGIGAKSNISDLFSP